MSLNIITLCLSLLSVISEIVRNTWFPKKKSESWRFQSRTFFQKSSHTHLHVPNRLWGLSLRSGGRNLRKCTEGRPWVHDDGGIYKTDFISSFGKGPEGNRFWRTSKVSQIISIYISSVSSRICIFYVLCTLEGSNVSGSRDSREGNRSDLPIRVEEVVELESEVRDPESNRDVPPTNEIISGRSLLDVIIKSTP